VVAARVRALAVCFSFRTETRRGEGSRATRALRVHRGLRAGNTRHCPSSSPSSSVIALGLRYARRRFPLISHACFFFFIRHGRIFRCVSNHRNTLRAANKTVTSELRQSCCVSRLPCYPLGIFKRDRSLFHVDYSWYVVRGRVTNGTRVYYLWRNVFFYFLGPITSRVMPRR